MAKGKEIYVDMLPLGFKDTKRLTKALAAAAAARKEVDDAMIEAASTVKLPKPRAAGWGFSRFSVKWGKRQAVYTQSTAKATNEPDIF